MRLRQTAIGVNYIDVYIRKGLYRMIEPPAPIGMEAAGVVVESNAPGFSPGDRVAYACPPPGAYVTMRTVPASQLVLLPDHVDEETAAALMLKGMTAEYLLHRTHRVQAGDTVLPRAAWACYSARGRERSAPGSSARCPPRPRRSSRTRTVASTRS